MEPPLDLDIAAAKAGDTQAFQRLYQANVGRVNALCTRLLRSSNKVEDAVQEAFIKAWRQLPKFRGDSSFSTWLHRIAARTAIDCWRQEQRTRLRFVSQDSDDQTNPDAIMTEGTNTSTSPSANEQRRDLERAIRRLPDQPRAVFVLFAIEGFSHKEIAAWLTIAEGTSKAHYHNARKLLQEYLDE